VVALSGDQVVGFTMGYIVPDDTSSLFVWQVAVAAALGRRGIASAMLQCILTRPTLQKVRYLETTVTPSNQASNTFFKAFATGVGAPYQTSEIFGAQLFGNSAHEAEILYRIGPFNAITQTQS